MKFPRLALATALSLCAMMPSAHAAAYYRFPTVRADAVVFTAEGDLWKVGLQGGPAQRLTTHPASELYPSISRDGNWLAFSASYEGAQEAYVMPLGGGVPKRLTFDNTAVTVLGWTAQGEVLVSMQSATGPSARRVVAAIDPGSMKKRVFQVADANEAALDDSGKTLYFTRYGLQMTGDNVKRYRGGAHAQLWRYDVDGKREAEPLLAGDAANAVNNKRPMWWQGRLYFVSDRDGADNLWSMKPDGSDLQKLSSHKDWDVRNAALGDGKISYQLGADIHVFDIAQASDRALAIKLLSDFDQQRSRLIRAPLEQLTSADLASKQERVVITARGHVSIAGTGTERRVDLSAVAGSRLREAVLGHDDKSVFAIVDGAGESEIWKWPADGAGKGEALTKDGDTHRWHLYPSPDGKRLAHSDKRGRLWLLDLATKANVVIDDAHKVGVDQHEQVAWSADGKTLALVRAASNQQRKQIGLYDLASKQLVFVTSDRYESSSPAFSPDGRWLYFLSDRNFQLANRSPWGDRNMGPVFDKRTGVYALALQPANRFPFKANDELSKAKPDAEKGDDEDDDKKTKGNDKAAAASTALPTAAPTKAGTPKIDYAGLASRLYEVPLAAGNYRALSVDAKRLYFLEQDAGDAKKADLKTLAIGNDTPKAALFAAGIREYALAADKKHLFYRTYNAKGPGDMLIVEAGAKAPTDLSKAKVSIDDWSFTIDPQQEWQQMFADAWRMHRDFLYDDKMRGVDWSAMRNKYAPLVERVTDRAELNDVLAMMVSEVGALHSQIASGDLRKGNPEGQAATLGAVLARGGDGYRIERIYRSEAELPDERSPLAQPDLDIREGDIITAVNNQPVLEARDIADLLLNQADKQVLLNVKRGQGASKPVIVFPINMQKHNNLRYTDWEQGRSKQVEAASQGRIGYLHLRAMGAGDIATFAREFYSNITRDGLIIDVRRNNGGNIDSWIIEKLLRKAWAFWSARGNQPEWNMQQSFRGHLVVLIDELTYSDGETFAAGIKTLGIAPLVGKRTAGAGVWLSDNNRLADNGMARAAETAQFGIDGHWLVEGVGVAPDVEVENLPHATFNGGDRQLEVALEMLEKKLEEQPVRLASPQAIPALR